MSLPGSPAPGGSSTHVVSTRSRGGECVLTLEYELDDDEEAAEEFGSLAVERDLNDGAGGAGAAKSAGYLNAHDKRHSHHGLAAVLILVGSLAFAMIMLALPVFVPPYDPWPTPLGDRTSYTFVEGGVRTTV